MSVIAHMLSSVIRIATPDDDPAGREAWIRRQRLEPLVFGVEMENISFRPEFMDECRQAYFNMSGRAARFSHEASRLVGLLSVSGIPALAWRGVVYGETLYDDPGFRYCTDIDLMVTPENRSTALDVMIRDGYVLRNRMIPRWYLSRHHLHWPLLRADGSIPVDLHWAVDHPYQDLSMPVDLDMMKRPSGMVQIAVYHAEKETRLRHIKDLPVALGRLFQDGPILPWIDLALIIARSSPEDLIEAEKQFSDRGHALLWSRSMKVLQTLCVGVSNHPNAEFSRVGYQVEARATHTTAVAHWFARRLGCRPEALADWFDYMCAPSTSRNWYQRVANFTRRLGKILVLVFDTVACGLWMALQSICGRKGGAVVS